MTNIKKNDVFTVTVNSIGSDGSGIARHNGVVVFVPFSAIGDVLEVRALKIAKSLIYAKIERIITPSADRAENDCPYFTKCGGCDFRHITYEAELRAKDGFIRDAFTRIGGLTPEFLPIIGSESICAYRNKAQFPVGKAENAVIYGFYAPRSHRIVPINNCRLHSEIFAEITAFITGFLSSEHISVYDESSHTGVMRHICVRKGHHSGEVHVTLTARRKIPEFAKLSRMITAKFPEVKGVSLNINSEKTNVVFGDKTETLVGNTHINDVMTVLGTDIMLKISPRSFYQVNTPAAEKLYGIISEFSAPDNKTILDLYCGIGAIGLSAAGKAREVIGVESVGDAVTDANENMRINGFGNMRFIQADSLDALKTLAGENITPDVIILDPARKGCEYGVLENAAALKPERIVMVSCDTAAAARDCSRLAGMGYAAVRVQGVDLFPRTRHVECCCLLTVDS